MELGWGWVWEQKAIGGPRSSGPEWGKVGCIFQA